MNHPLKRFMNHIGSACLCFLVAMAVAVPAMADRDYKKHRGYRERPYNKERHYEHAEHGRQKYSYQGHWRSWNDWDDYYHGNPRLRDYGNYYREEGHLMFRYCDPGNGSCFFFSIGQ